jgi:hypothetical protein
MYKNLNQSIICHICKENKFCGPLYVSVFKLDYGKMLGRVTGVLPSMRESIQKMSLMRVTSHLLQIESSTTYLVCARILR